MNGLQIKLQLDDNQPAHWFDVETINFDDEVCFTDGVGECIEIEYQGEPLRIKSPSLTDDQQVVLEWLKSNLDKGNYPMMAIVNMQNIDEDDPCFYAYDKLTTKEDWEVLAAFAEWGLNSFQNGNSY